MQRVMRMKNKMHLLLGYSVMKKSQENVLNINFGKAVGAVELFSCLGETA